MTKKHPLLPKGEAMSLHLSPEYAEAFHVAAIGGKVDNPYDFFDEYTQHYAWDIGFQAGKKATEDINS